MNTRPAPHTPCIITHGWNTAAWCPRCTELHAEANIGDTLYEQLARVTIFAIHAEAPAKAILADITFVRLTEHTARPKGGVS